MKKLALYSLFVIGYSMVTCIIRASMGGPLFANLLPVVVLSPAIVFFVKYLS